MQNAFNAEPSKDISSPTTTDLSHLAGDTGATLIGGESSSAGNTINDPVTTIGAAPGSQPVNVTPQTPASHYDTPSVEVPSAQDYTRKP